MEHVRVGVGVELRFCVHVQRCVHVELSGVLDGSWDLVGRKDWPAGCMATGRTWSGVVPDGADEDNGTIFSSGSSISALGVVGLAEAKLVRVGHCGRIGIRD